MPLWALLVAVVVATTASVVIAAILPKVFTTLVLKPAVQVVKTDPRIDVFNLNETTLVVATASAAADPGTADLPKEFDSPYTKVYATAITAGDFVYRFVINETSVAALPVGVKYRVDVYASYNAGTTYQLLATAYVGQSTAVDTAVEGVEVWVDLGTRVPDYIQIVVVQIAGAPP